MLLMLWITDRSYPQLLIHICIYSFQYVEFVYLNLFILYLVQRINLYLKNCNL